MDIGSKIAITGMLLFIPFLIVVQLPQRCFSRRAEIVIGMTGILCICAIFVGTLMSIWS